MKNGSKKPRKGKVVTSDVTDMVKTPHREAPVPHTDGSHLRALAPIPEGAHKDPIGFAEKHIESLAPHSAKELEWSLKFGSDQARRQTALDLLAMKGLTTKPKEATAIQQAMVFNVTGTMLPNGAPLLPFMNATAPLAPAATPVTVAPEAPTKKADTK